MKEIQLCDILIKDTSYLTEKFQVKKHQNIVIKNGRIEAIYPYLIRKKKTIQERKNWTEEDVYGCRG